MPARQTKLPPPALGAVELEPPSFSPSLQQPPFFFFTCLVAPRRLARIHRRRQLLPRAGPHSRDCHRAANMVYALVALFSRREDLTHDEFKCLFEGTFIPLLERVSGPLFPLTYSRRYIAHHSNDEQRKKKGALGLDAIVIGKEEDVPWDCIADMTFEDDLHMNQFLNFINEEGPGDQIMACEATFSDTSKLRIIMMENNVSVNKSRRPKTWEDQGDAAIAQATNDHTEAETISSASIADVLSNVSIEEHVSEQR